MLISGAIPAQLHRECCDSCCRSLDPHAHGPVASQEGRLEGADMKRRDFLRCGSAAAGTALLGLHQFPHHVYASATKKTAQDLVTLGKTGIQVTRLAQGTGTNGVNRSSNQIRTMGDKGLSDLLVRGVDKGVHFWDLADQYGSHPHAKRA